MDEPSKSSSKTKSSSSSRSKSSSSSKDGKSSSSKEEFSSDFLRQKLKEHFKHTDFKSTLQKEAIKEIMRGKRDVYVSMPTGSGKSLCYQLPGMLHDNKITIVFSPLIALIKDQMDHLTKLKINAESLNSKMTVKERERVINDLRSIKPSTKFLYITPEQAATQFFRGLLDSIVKYNKLALVAVDECHCVSEMGHQFRRDYLKLGELRQRYPTVKWIALTATASKDVTQDVFKQLSLKEPKSFKTPCFRKNLFYDIVYKNSIQDDFIHLRDFVMKCLKSDAVDVKPNKAPCGIIYCRTRESVERVAVGLSKQGVITKPYHAGLNDKDRKQIQEDWTNGIFPVISATNSFGMGVDKSSVRFVVHWDCPQNIAAYYQESGRAGRDGKQSFCRLYYCRQEVKSISFLLGQQLQKTPDCVKAKRSVKEFDKLVVHCEALHCRHLLFSHYFGDQPPDCKKRKLCDACKDHKSAEKKLEVFHQLSLNSFTSKMEVGYDPSELYEGGRNAVQEAEANYSQDNDDDYGSESTSERNSRARKETSNLIQKEFERRKQKLELTRKLEQTQTRANGIRVRSSIHTSKIPGLDVKKRESYLDFLLKVIKDNAEKSNEQLEHSFKACDYEDIAAEMEYNCFTKNRVLAMYTKSITVERLRIDRLTKNKELLPEVKSHVPKKRTAHGGSSEVMQKDLDDFMQKHNMSDNSEPNTNTHATGFQTARQINNKLKEPNRMKKDPLTQMSINSFFSTASIKREPEDGGDAANSSEQQAKRRRVEETATAVKAEPPDNGYDEPRIVPKTEADDSDSEMMDCDGDGYETEEDTSNQVSKGQTTGSSRSGAIRIKPEIDSENDTDEGSDDESQYFINHGDKAPANAPAKKSRKKTASQERGAQVPNDGRTTVKYEVGSDVDSDVASDDDANNVVVNDGGTHSSREKTSKSGGKHSNMAKQHEHESHNLNYEPTLDDDDVTTMVVAEAIKTEISVKADPDDVDSGEETDDDGMAFMGHVKPTQFDKRTQNAQPVNSQPSTSNSIYSQYLAGLPQAPSANMYNSGASVPLNVVGLRTLQPIQLPDLETEPVRFNHFENVITVEEPVEEYDENSTEIGEFTEIHTFEELEKLVRDEEEQISQMKGNLNDMRGEELAEFRNRLNKLVRNKKVIANHKSQEIEEKAEERKLQMKDLFLLDLFGYRFDLDDISDRFRAHCDTKPTDTQSKAETKPMKYYEFMDKPMVKRERKTVMEHFDIITKNEYVQEKKNANQLDRVPKHLIESVKSDKTIITNKVKDCLMPYFNKGTINKKHFEILCKNISKIHFENNDYDSKSIQKRVDDQVTALLRTLEAINRQMK